MVLKTAKNHFATAMTAPTERGIETHTSPHVGHCCTTPLPQPTWAEITTCPSCVADPGCLSRILIFTHPDPGSLIPEPKTATEERGEKNLMSYLFM